MPDYKYILMDVLVVLLASFVSSTSANTCGFNKGRQEGYSLWIGARLKKVTYLCVVRLLLDSTTVLEVLFGEYHFSSAALGKQHLGVTKQPPSVIGGRSNTPLASNFEIESKPQHYTWNIIFK